MWTPWTIIGAGRTRGVPESDFKGFGMILGHHFESFLGVDEINSVFLSRIVSRRLFGTDFSIDILTVKARKIRFSY